MGGSPFTIKMLCASPGERWRSWLETTGPNLYIPMTDQDASPPFRWPWLIDVVSESNVESSVQMGNIVGSCAMEFRASHGMVRLPATSDPLSTSRESNASTPKPLPTRNWKA